MPRRTSSCAFTAMQVTREELNPCTIKLTVVCDEAQIKEGYDKAVKQFAKKVKVPGFRPGTAPKAMVEQMISEPDLIDQSADNIARTAFKAAIEQEKLEPHSQPHVEITAYDKAESKFEMTILVPMPPVVELGDYKTLTATRPPLETTEEEVTSYIEEMRRRKSKREAVTDRGVQQGDVAVVNIRLAGEEGDGRTFMTIAGQTFPQLDEALMGMEAEQMKALNLTFPENFQEKDWATKTFDCQITLRSLSTMKLPDLDDTFAKEFDVENLDEFKERVKESMGHQKVAFFQNYVNEQLLDSLRAASTVHVPDTMWLDVANQRLRETAIEQQKQGKTLEDFAKANNMTVEALIDAQKNEARVQVERAVMVQKIFELEEMKLTNNDLSEQLMILSQEYNMDPKEVLNTLKKNESVNELQFGAMFRKVLEKLNTFATITEEAPQGE